MKKSNPEELLNNGLHFGHRSPKVHPRSKKYIYKIENGVSIIDLFQTAELLDEAIKTAFELGKENKNLLVVATKKQAKSIVKESCSANNVNFLTFKWIAGFLTNFPEIHKNVKKLKQLKADKEMGEWNKFPKHERVLLDKELAKLTRIYEGVENMDKVPDAMFIIDIKKENNACIEAEKMNIKTIAITDTNTNPEIVSLPIPANDDAITSIKYITEKIIESYIEGKKEYKPEEKKN